MSLEHIAQRERDEANKDLDTTNANLDEALAEKERINKRIAELRAHAKFYTSRLTAAQKRLDSLTGVKS